MHLLSCNSEAPLEKTQTFLPSSDQQARVKRLRRDVKSNFIMLVPGLSLSSKNLLAYASELNMKRAKPFSVMDPPFGSPSSKVTLDA